MSWMLTRAQSWLLRYRQANVGPIRAKDEQPMARESLNALLSDLDRGSQHGDLTEETLADMHAEGRALQLR